jgi:hypothetical protein
MSTIHVVAIATMHRHTGVIVRCMPLLKAVVTLPYFSGAPEDVATNTFHFQSPVGTSVAATVVAASARLGAFYTAVGVNFSKVLTSPGTIKYYDLADPSPRLPVGSGSVSWTASVPAFNLPEEVAVCVSYQAAPVSGANQARRRGRVFLGPMNFSAFTNPTTGSFVQVLPAYRTTLATAASAMANPATNVANWVVYSPTDNLAHPVASGWIDVQPDVQRRRGHKVAGRTLWTAP